MNGFIEVEDVKGVVHCINTRWIECVIKSEDGNACTIYLAFTNPDCPTQDYVVTNEPYDKIVTKIKVAGSSIGGLLNL